MAFSLTDQVGTPETLSAAYTVGFVGATRSDVHLVLRARKLALPAAHPRAVRIDAAQRLTLELAFDHPITQKSLPVTPPDLAIAVFSPQVVVTLRVAFGVFTLARDRSTLALARVVPVALQLRPVASVNVVFAVPFKEVRIPHHIAQE